MKMVDFKSFDIENSLFDYLKKTKFFINSNFDVGFNMDHFWFSVSTKEKYKEFKNFLLKNGNLIREVVIKDRLVSVFSLNKDIAGFKKMELEEPKPDEVTLDEVKHVAFLVDDVFSLFNKAIMIKNARVCKIYQFNDANCFKINIDDVEIEFRDKTI